MIPSLHSQNRSNMRSFQRLSRLPLLLAVLTPTWAQTTVCVCSPRVYDITLDFSRTCADNSGFGAGVQETRCNIVPFDNPSDTDLVPEIVTLIDVSELGQDLQSIVGSQRLTGRYENGDTITISSETDNREDIDINNLPKAFQMSMIGINASGGTLVFSALIVYTSSCESYPVLLFGASNGWALLVSHCHWELLASAFFDSHFLVWFLRVCSHKTEQVGPNADLCPAIATTDPSSVAPSITLTLPPIASEATPTVAPIAPEATLTPTAAPVSPPEATPTAAPMANPPEATSTPTAAPIVLSSPTRMPVVSRTPGPTTTTQINPTNRPIRTLLPTPIQEPGKKKMVCKHIQNSDKVSKSGNGSKSSKFSKSGKGGGGKKSGKKTDKKGKKKNKRKKNKKGKHRFLEIQKRNVYFRVDAFRERDADLPTVNATNTTSTAGPDKEIDYLTIYKEVFKDVECYEVDVESNELSPTTPLMSVGEPHSPISISPAMSLSPTVIVPPTTVPTDDPSISNITESFQDLVLENANMTLSNRSYTPNSTLLTESSNTSAVHNKSRIIPEGLIIATMLGGTILLSVLLLRWYGPKKPMWQIIVPSHSSIADSIQSCLTDDKRMGV